MPAAARRRTLALVAVMLVGLSACGTPDAREAAPAAPSDGTAPTLLPRKPRPTLPPVVAPTTTTPPPSRVPRDATIDAATASDRYAVGLTTLSFTDTTRATPARGSQAARDSRSLVTTVRYPAIGPPDATPSQLEPAKASGPYPLVVFVHGFNTSAARYDQLLTKIAAAGYVVVAPDFPLTSSALPGPAIEADVSNQPDDVKFVISRLLTVNDQPGPLQGLVVPDKIAVAGHSDGGNTAAATAYNTCCTDTRVKAAVILAGEKSFFPDTWFTAPGPPFLGIHSDNDEITPYQNGRSIYTDAGPPKYFVTVQGGNHQDPFMGGTQTPPATPLIIDFLDGYLRGDSAAVAKLRSDGNQAPFKLEYAAP